MDAVTRLGCVLAALGLAAGLAADPMGLGVDLRSGWAVPLSPQGPGSFSTDYQAAWVPGLALTYRLDQAWELGLESQAAVFGQKYVAQTQLLTWAAGLMGEWDLPPEDAGTQDHLYLQLALGGGGAALSTSALYQNRQWASVYGRLGLGWAWPLQPWLSLLLQADAFSILGPGKTDPIAAADLGLGLRFGSAPPAGAAP